MSGQRLIGATLLVLGAVAAVLAVMAALTGGFRVYLLGVPLSVRGEHRAALFAIIFITAGLSLHAGARARLGGLLTGPRVPPAAAWILSLGMLWIGLTYGTKAAAGSDVYGYVSQVPLWLSGTLHVPQPLAAEVPWPNADWTFSPLGYRPAGNHTIVPTYAPGIPMLMAVFVTLFGAGAAFWVTPLSGALVVLLTYAIGARFTSRAVALAGAACVAASPLVLHMTCWLLGDLPAAALWMLALWLAMHGTAATALGAGLATAIAILVRPNLVPLALFPPLLIVAAKPTLATWRQLTLFAIAAAPGPLFIAWLFDHLYGSPLRSGYGDNADLFRWQFVNVNVRQFAAWMWEAHGPFSFLFPLTVLLAPRGARTVRGILLAFVAAVTACYLAYQPFDAWWYLRFLLPGVPLMLLLSVDVVWNLAGRWRTWAKIAGVVLVAELTCAWELRLAVSADVLSIGRGEQRYADVGSFVDRVLPQNAVILAMQHSGSLRYYSGRQTVRWDYLPHDWLDRGVQYLESSGHVVYVLLDEFEVPPFRERFTGQVEAQVLESRPPLDTEALRVSIYRLGRR